MSYLIQFIHSKGVSCFYYNNTQEPLTEQEFIVTLENINNENKYNNSFPLNVSFDEYTTFVKNSPPIPKFDPIITSMKKIRNILLEKSDWLLTYDNVQTLENLNEWITYRQTLRTFFSNPLFKVILLPGSQEPDLMAMNFPPKQPPIIRKKSMDNIL